MFKNITIFRVENMKLSASELEKQLKGVPFNKCSASTLLSTASRP